MNKRKLEKVREKDRILNMIHLDVKYIEELWNNLHFEPRDSDFLSYRYFTQYFKNTEKIKEEHFIIGSNFCYGWMPRMLTIQNMDNITVVTEILNKAKNQESLLNISELDVLKKTVNNSIVGVSKLLHFINPRMYPIWDSRVGRCFGITENTKINNSKIYLEYTDAMVKFCNDYGDFVDNIKNILGHKMGYSISRVRAIEFILFQAGNNKNAN